MNQTAEQLLSVENLDTGYAGVPVVRDLDIYLNAGEVVALLGPNGAGKTTTLLTVSGIIPLLGGSIKVLGENVDSKNPHKNSRLGLSHVAEDRSLFFNLTVKENLQLGLRGDKESQEEGMEKEDEDEEKVNEMQTQLKEYKDTIGYLREKLNEVNLLNAKLLFTNKLFRSFGLNNNQKLSVVEQFDRTQNLREIKLVYATLAESFKGNGNKKVNESKGQASKAVASTEPKKEVLSEGQEMKNRFKKLANLI